MCGRSTGAVLRGGASLVLLALFLSACASPGVASAIYTRSQQGQTHGTAQLCARAAEIVWRADRAVELLRPAMESTGVAIWGMSKFVDSRIWVCLAPQLEGCGSRGTGPLATGCALDSTVRVFERTPPLCSDPRAAGLSRCAASEAEQSRDYIPQLVHEIAHALQRDLDPRHSVEALWGPGGVVARVVAEMRGECRP